MSQKTYLTILKIGIYLSFISVFLVFKSLLFPFITSKQIFFNILIEVLFVFWFAFIIKYPEYRPKKNWISIGLIGFFIAIIISCFTGVDFNLSFWGDIERMLGVFHLLHFLIFYFIIITVFRARKDWRNLLIASVATAVLLSLYILTGKTAYGTIGNTAYVSGYAIFNIFFAVILFFQYKYSEDIKNKIHWVGFLFLLAAIIMVSIFKLTHTRGAYVGLGIGVIVALLLFIILSKNKKVKFFSLSAAAILIILVSLVFANSGSSIVKNSSILSTMTQISSQAVTFQTRLIAWEAAFKDFPNHPILGTGHGNFAVTFDKYFDPSFYNYTRSETYFDRAHNNIVDIVSTTGLAGLLSYLSIFAACGYYLIKGYRKKIIQTHEFILLISLIIAYFIQNLAVFDSLITYISLMVMLGFIYWLNFKEGDETSSRDALPLVNKEIYALAGVGLVMLIIIFQHNIKPLKMLKGTIDGQIAFARGDMVGGVEAYKKALSYNTILDRDSRDSLIRIIAARSSLLNNIDKQKAREILDWTIELTERNIEYNEQDSLMQMELSQILNLSAMFNQDDQEKFYFYSDSALKAINKSIESSPGRIPIYFQKAQIYAARGERDKAIEILQYAIKLNESYYDSYCYLARYYFSFGQKENGFTAMDQCIDKGGIALLIPADYVKGLISHYVETEDWTKILKLYQRLSQLEPKNAKVWVNLATLYAQVGNKEQAIKAAEKSAEIDPSMKDAAEEFIKELEK